MAQRWLPVLAAGIFAGCSTPVVRPAAVPKPAPLPVTSFSTFSSAEAPEVALQPDPIAELIGGAETAFEAGQADNRAGHPAAARDHFDQAVDLLLTVPGGARQNPRISTALDRLLDRVSALDAIALREADGFTEAGTEPAAIDALLGAAPGPRLEPARSTADKVADDLASTPHDVPMTINSKVLSYVELFQGNLRDFLQEGLSNSMKYLPMIEDVFRTEGVPHDLAYVPLVESAFKPTAYSSASARGLWQFIQDTAQENGLKRSWFIDERSDPEKATRAAAVYLKSLNEMFGGDWNLALAGYNAGPGRIQRAIKLSKTTDFWKMSATTKYLPRETREYVPMIIAAIIIAKNPERYGFDITPAPPVPFERVIVPDALDLKYIAEWAGVPVTTIQQLNPELRRTTTPDKKHDLKVPMGTAAAIEAKLAAVDPSLFSTFKFHTVKRGETLTTIARDNKITISELRQANDLSAKARAQIGQALRIPERRASVVPATAASTGSATAGRPATTPAAPESAGPSTDAPPTTYRVQRGDSLSSIAKKFGTSIAELRLLNNLSSDDIMIGAKLTVKR